LLVSVARRIRDAQVCSTITLADISGDVANCT